MDIRVRVHLAHFWKIRLFLALFGKSWYSSNCQHHCQQGSVYLQQLVVASAEVLEKSQIFQKCAKCTLTLMSNHEIDFWQYIQILHIKNEWNLCSLSLALFFFNHNEFWTGWWIMNSYIPREKANSDSWSCWRRLQLLTLGFIFCYVCCNLRREYPA